jgi:hypothetical protein
MTSPGRVSGLFFYGKNLLLKFVATNNIGNLVSYCRT